MTARGHLDAPGIPRPGDLVALADTGLTLRVEDSREPRDGYALLTGFGKTGRDGIGLRAVRTEGSCDVVVTNVLVVDPVYGVRVASIGIREGRITGIGRAGNPDTTDRVDVVVGTSSIIVPGEGLIATAGAVDTHVHLLSPRICEAALASGVTTLLGQEFGPFWGPGVNSRWGLATAYRAFDAWPVNIGFLGRGSSARPGPLEEALEAGVCAFKVHEDLGAHRRSLDTALTVAEEHDVQVCLHTDGLNENLALADTVAVLEGRTVHAYHVEGCGGGHVPDVLELAGIPYVIGSSTNPTLPYARDAVAEHEAMIVAVHGLRPSLPGELRLAHDRVRAATMGAETVLHDLGVIPITSSDAQGMGRAGETIRRTFAMAAVNKSARGPLDGDGPADPAAGDPGSDNVRVLRYLAKLTINPAIAHGIDHEIGSIEVGKLADLVLWRPELFGAKPSLVLKSGLPAWGAVGDPNAAVDTAEPLVLGPQFAGSGAAPAEVSVVFVNAAAVRASADRIPTRRRRVAVCGTRGIGLDQMLGGNHRTGRVQVRPDASAVTLDGEELRAVPADRLPLARLYHL
ncbi:MAG TPA: urease subunit alpha [Kineosporiaceae bacterium]|nr:urease subunit alpha [Kineosporiaceae bacterium]